MYKDINFLEAIRWDEKKPKHNLRDMIKNHVDKTREKE